MKLKSSREVKEYEKISHESAFLDNNQCGIRTHLDQLGHEQLGLLYGECAEGRVGKERDGRRLTRGGHVRRVEHQTDLTITIMMISTKNAIESQKDETIIEDKMVMKLFFQQNFFKI